MPCVPGRLVFPLVNGLKFSIQGPLGDGTNVTEPPRLAASELDAGAPELQAASATAPRRSRDRSGAAPRKRIRMKDPLLIGYAGGRSIQATARVRGGWCSDCLALGQGGECRERTRRGTGHTLGHGMSSPPLAG